MKMPTLPIWSAPKAVGPTMLSATTVFRTFVAGAPRVTMP
jgi:hypothetical protein